MRHTIPSDTRERSAARFAYLCPALAALVLLAAPTPPAAAQGVRYHIAPAASHIKWADNFGLEDVTLLGGRLGANFGGLIGLDAYYLRRDNVQTIFGSSGITAPGGIPLIDQSLKLQQLGADLRVNLGTGALQPFAAAGAGVMRFEPETGSRFDQIVVKYGGGVRFDLAPGISGQVHAENIRMRLDRFAMAAPGGTPYPADPDADEVRNHLSFGAALGFAIGGRGQPERERWSMASLAIEPYVARLDFDQSNLATQWMTGARAGIDLGQYFGLRGYYLRGVNDDFNAFAPIESYGVEGQFNFNRGRGPAPFLLAGAGRLDFHGDYRDLNDVPVENRNAFILGGGVGIRLTDQLSLNVAVRDFITSEADFEDVASTAQLRHNVMLSAGVGIAFGRGRTENRSREDDRFDDRDRRSDRDREARDRDDRDRRDERDRRFRDERRKSDCARDDEQCIRRERERARTGDDGHVSGRTVTLPVPREGELYVRYGPGASIRRGDSTAPVRSEVSDSSLRETIRQELRAARVDTVAVRVESDSARTARIVRETMEAIERERGLPVPSRVAPQEPTPYVAPVASAPITMRDRSPQLYTGFNLDTPTQLVIGGLLDLTPGQSNSIVRFLPELAFGFGDGGTSFMAAANVGIRLPRIAAGRDASITPHARLGLGLLTYGDAPEGVSGTQGVLNFTYGISTDLVRIGGLGRPLFTIEHQGLDLFDSNRLLVGLQWRR